MSWQLAKQILTTPSLVRSFKFQIIDIIVKIEMNMVVALWYMLKIAYRIVSPRNIRVLLKDELYNWIYVYWVINEIKEMEGVVFL